MAIRVFITGGTFDKTYDEIAGTLRFQDTHVREMLQLGRCRLDVAVRTLMMVDSLEMTDADRQVVLQNCRSAAEDRILVTHGTDTMVDTARELGEASLAKTIVLTGAMVPYAFGSPVLDQPPAIRISPAAMDIMQNALEKNPGKAICLRINGGWKHSLSLEAPRPGSISVSVEPFTIDVDSWSATRADGLSIDVLDSVQGRGFRFDNPNAPAG